MIISPAPVPNVFRAEDGTILKMATFELGGWDMTVTQSINVNIAPILYTHVRSVVGVFQDLTTNTYDYGCAIQDGVDRIPIQFSRGYGYPQCIKCELSTLAVTAYYAGTMDNRGYLNVWYYV